MPLTWDAEKAILATLESENRSARRFLRSFSTGGRARGDAAHGLAQGLGGARKIDAREPTTGVAEGVSGVQRDPGVAQQTGCGLIAPAEPSKVEPSEIAGLRAVVL